jgi:hypothetical protein
MTDTSPPPPETPILLLLFAAFAGAVLTGAGYIVDRAVWPDHDPVVPVLQLLH